MQHLNTARDVKSSHSGVRANSEAIPIPRDLERIVRNDDFTDMVSRCYLESVMVERDISGRGYLVLTGTPEHRLHGKRVARIQFELIQRRLKTPITVTIAYRREISQELAKRINTICRTCGVKCCKIKSQQGVEICGLETNTEIARSKLVFLLEGWVQQYRCVENVSVPSETWTPAEPGTILNTAEGFAAGNDVTSRKYRMVVKRLEIIFEDHGTLFPYVDSAPTMQRLEVQASEIRRVDITAVMKRQVTLRNVDLCFVIDTTASMTDHLGRVKKVIEGVVDQLRKPLVPNKVLLSSLRLACVAYRDRDCDKNFQVQDFTSDEVFFQFLKQLEAASVGNSDFPEDVLTALQRAANLKGWSKEAGVKLILHMGDAPPHGKKYHGDEMGDNHPDGYSDDPKAEDIFKNFDEQGIWYFFGKIQNYTDKMIQNFAAASRRPIRVFDVANYKKVGSVLRDVVISSVDMTSMLYKMPILTATEKRTYSIDMAIPVLNQMEIVEGEMQALKMPASIEDVLHDMPFDFEAPARSEIMKIAKNPFFAGKERLAFYGMLAKNTSGDLQYVFKEYIRKGKCNRCHDFLQCQAVAICMGSFFSNELKKLGTSQFSDLKFLNIESFITPTRFMTCEPKCPDRSVFVNFSNFAVLTMSEEKPGKHRVDSNFVDLVQAFSHWTYCVTGRHVLITDIQGVVSSSVSNDILLTDPTIHCKDLNRYGPLNLGGEGMQQFFNTTHPTCNGFCSALNLERPIPGVI